MKQDKMAGIILTAVNIILAVVCIVLYLRTDRTEPRFVIQPAEIVYREDMEETFLFEGIAAHDDRDGEITDRIVIEKKVENRAENSVIVYYAVSDSAGNVAKFSKLFPAEYPVEVQAAVSEAGGGEPIVRQLAMEQTAPDDTADDENEPETDNGTNQEQDSEENGMVGLDGEDEPEDVDGDTGMADEKDDPNESEQVPAARNTVAPELVFRTTEVTINSGTNVPWTEIISTLRDDKDDYATLYYNLQVSQYNRNRPGTYPVTVYTEDSDGNRSQTVPVTITVR